MLLSNAVDQWRINMQTEHDKICVKILVKPSAREAGK